MTIQSHILIPPNLHAIPIKQLSLSVRLRGVLRLLGCQSLGDLSGLTWEQLAKVRNCGSKTIGELQALVTQCEEHSDGKYELLLCSEVIDEPASQPPARPSVIHIPQNARGWPLEHLPVSVRLAGVLERMKFVLLGDLRAHPTPM